MALDKGLHPDEYLDFGFDSAIPLEEYMELSALNGRYFLLKEDPSTIPIAKRKMVLLAVLHYGLLSMFWVFVFYWVGIRKIGFI